MAKKNAIDERMLKALWQTDFKTIQELLDGGYPLNELSFYGKTNSPLQLAVSDRKVKLARFLLEAGADPDLLCGQHQDAALHMACYEGDQKCVEALIEHGADANLPNGYGVVPIVKAIESKHAMKLLKILVAAGGKLEPHGRFGPMHSAARQADPSVIDYLVDGGCGVNAWVNDMTPLMEAVSEYDTVRVQPTLRGFSATPRPKIVQKLLDHGADPLSIYRRNLSPEKGKDTTGKSIVEYANEVGLPKPLLTMLGGKSASKGKPASAKQSRKKAPNASRRGLSVSDLFSELKSHWKQENPGIIKTLRRGAGEKALASLATETEQAIPEEFRQLWSLHDGQKPGADGIFGVELFDKEWVMLPVKDITREWNIWYDLLMSGDFEGTSVSTDGKVRSVWYHEDWMPIAGDGAGNFLCLDLNPTAKGKAGQVLVLDHEDGDRRVIAGSLKQFLADALSGV